MAAAVVTPIGDGHQAGSARPRAGSSIQAVERALMLLELIADAGGECTLGTLAERAGLNASTCHHLLATLVQRGYVCRGAGRRTYALGPRLLQIGQVCMRSVDLPQRAQPYLDRINDRTGEAVHLAAMQGDELVTLLHREARHAVRVVTGHAGKTSATHATATGKAILAWLPEAEIRRIVALRGMQRFTPHTLTEFDALIEELRLVRRNGFSTDREEFQPYVVCVGAAIRDHGGAVVGSISASAPTMRAEGEHLELMRREVMAAAAELSAELGSPAAPAPPAGLSDVAD